VRVGVCVWVWVCIFLSAEIDAGTMMNALEDRHVTTWENVLPALLLYGDAARQVCVCVYVRVRACACVCVCVCCDM